MSETLDKILDELSTIDQVGLPWQYQEASTPVTNFDKQDVSKLLRSAGTAVSALTNTKQTLASDGSPQGDISSRCENFRDAASSYFETLSSIDRNLRRQISALDAEQVLSTGTKGTRTAPESIRPASTAATSGLPMGGLDVGPLNSRNATISQNIEHELWCHARDLLTKTQQRGTTSPAASASAADD